MDISSAEKQIWDVIIVGTGMGGGSLGLKLAQAGYRVLFIEKGKSQDLSSSIQGQFAEMNVGASDHRQAYGNAGRFSDVIFDSSRKKIKKLHPFIGSGVGGSSALYGMVLERFHPSDFVSWPLTYDHFKKYYEEAESLFKVQSANNFAHPGHTRLAEHLKSLNLTPYALPLAHDNRADCNQCQSMLCAKKCKNDSGKICITPATENYGAQILTECEVQKIESESDQVTGVSIQCKNEKAFIKGRIIVLSAGALQSPLLLLNSKSKHFPQGLGNQSGLVGRYLMRHFVDLYALRIDSDQQNKNVKEIGFNDFYLKDGVKLGTVQSFGRLPPGPVITQQLGQQIEFRPLKWIFKIVRPLLNSVLDKKTSKYLVMASIVEDEPHVENRVWSEDGKIFLNYKISKTDESKIKNFRKKLKTLFHPFGLWFIPSSEKNEMLAHACGTCRMDGDPAKGVVDKECRVHGVKNLYLVDSSFFPTSGGTNPALTIAANALRVAEIISETLKGPANGK